MRQNANPALRLPAPYGSFPPLHKARDTCAASGRRSSVVERTLGKGEVECSIHSGGTISFPAIFILSTRLKILAIVVLKQRAGISLPLPENHLVLSRRYGSRAAPVSAMGQPGSGRISFRLFPGEGGFIMPQAEQNWGVRG